MTLVYLYWLLLLGCCTFAAVAGGATGRWGCGIIVLGSAASLFADLMDPRWTSVQYPLLWVDMVCSAALISLALWSPRYWPSWSAAFQTTATLMHLARTISPDAPPKLYQAFESFWAVPMLLAMFIGIHLDRVKGL